MILDLIELENFGVFGGKHAIVLTPSSPERNVILLGGLNGGGKTTLLDALLLVLYGKRANCHNRKGHPYGEFLRSCIHRGAGPDASAAITLEFRSVSEGVQRSFRLSRSWTGKGKALSDRVTVEVDGTYDRVLSDTWDDAVEDLIPSRIAPLFFFDGERIEALADPETSRDMLASALHSLLGLDLVEQLRSDLVVLQRRKTVQTASDADLMRIGEMQVEVGDLEQRKTGLKQDRAQAENVLDRARQSLQQLDLEVSRQGGTLLEEREHLESERSRVSAELRSVETEMQGLAAGPLPLALVRHELESLHEQALAEERAAKAATVVAELRERDSTLLSLLATIIPDESDYQRVRDHLSQDMQSRESASGMQAYLYLPEEGRHLLAGLLDHRLDADVRHAQRLLSQSEALASRLVDLDRRLGSVPDEDAVAALFEQRAKARQSLLQAEIAAGVLDEEISRVSRELVEKHRALDRIVQQRMEQRLQLEETDRLIEYAGSARDVLAAFRERLVTAHVGRIGDHVTECYQGLMRKKGLVAQVRIPPGTLVPELLSTDGQAIPADRLSAGERQLLAVALLWGLARASGQQLPVVVDSPLGRLDSDHRQNLVNGYFPKAGPQVILLSTNEEIAGEYYRSLRSAIGREYTLAFDDSLGTTWVLPGYPWSE